MKNRILSLFLSILFLMQLVGVPVLAAEANHRNPYIKFNAKDIDDKNIVDAVSSFKTNTMLAGLRETPNWVCYKNMDFGDKGPVSVNIDIAGGNNGQKVILTADAPYPSGEVIAEVTAIPAGWGEPTNCPALIFNEITGVRDVYLQLVGTTMDIYTILFKNGTDNESLPFYSDAGDAYDDIADDPNRHIINMLSSFGFLHETESGNYHPNLPVTRGEFAYSVFKLYGIKDMAGPHETGFADVEPNAYYAQAVKYLSNAGIINGISSEEFRPGDFIRHIDAAAILCRILELDGMVNYFGGYSQGYLEAATRQKLMVSGLGPHDILKKTDMAKLLNNALQANGLEATAIENSNIIYEAKQGILTKTQHAQWASGMVETNYLTNLYVPESDLETDKVLIDGTVYNKGNTNAAEYIGFECEFFYTEDRGEKTLVMIYPLASTETYEISSKKDSIISISDSGISYCKADETRTKNFEISSSTAVIYNGKAIHASLETITGPAASFKGSIRFVENECGINTVLIDQYYSTVVKTVVENRSLIQDHSTPIKNINLDEDVAYSEVTKQGIAVTLSDITEGNVITVYESKNTKGKKVYRVFASDAIVSGTIEEISEDEVKIDGQSYVISPGAIESFEVGQEGIFKLDIHNEIVAYEEGKSLDMPVALLLDSTTTDGFDSRVKLKLFTGKGQEEVLTLAQNAVVDGNTSKNPADSWGKDLKKLIDTELSPVRYLLNDAGEIKVLDTILTGSGGMYDTLVKIVSNPAAYRWLSNVICYSGQTVGLAYMPSAADIFISHYNANNEAEWTLTTASDGIKESNTIAQSMIYSSTGDTRLCDILVWNDPNGHASGFELDAGCVFKNCVKTVGNEGELVYKLTFISGGTEIDYTFNEEAYQNSALLKNLRAGDVIRFRPNLGGDFRTNSAEVIFYRDAISTELVSGSGVPLVSAKKATNGTRSTTGATYIYGNVVEKTKEYILIAPKDGSEHTMIRRQGTVARLTEHGANGEIALETGLKTDVLGVGDEVLAILKTGTTITVVIYDINEGR